MARLLAAVALAFGLVACAQTRSSDREAAAPNDTARPVAKTAGADEDIPLDQVPAAAMKAAEGAVPGATFTSAEKETEHGTTVYSIAGTSGGKPCEVEVTADGKVTEIDLEDDEEEDDDGDDGEDDED
jgi:uncharacterized membrane protein YkoI